MINPAPHTLPLPVAHRLLPVPGGSFCMGSDKARDPNAGNDEMLHKVSLSPFYIGEHPVTQDLWATVMKEHPSPAHFKGDRRPVEQVSWFDAAVFCNRLSVDTGKTPCYCINSEVYGLSDAKHWDLPNTGAVVCDFQADGYRLPTEAEWEYAARGGSDPLFSYMVYAGSDHIDQVGWYEGNSGNSTRDTGLLLPNALGLYDMSGNVLEWCKDWYGSDYYEKSPPIDPKGPENGAYRVLRGGSCFREAHHCRSAYRFSLGPGSRDRFFGFRLALSL